jgi:PiT family inorganic phosphate transporter
MALFRWSRRNRVTHNTLLNDIDDAGRVVHIKKTPRRPRRRDRAKVAR